MVGEIPKTKKTGKNLKTLSNFFFLWTDKDPEFVPYFIVEIKQYRINGVSQYLNKVSSEMEPGLVISY